jgi:hypothetical protein
MSDGAVGARETREGGAGGAESDEAGEGEVLCGVVFGWDWKGRGARVYFSRLVTPYRAGRCGEARYGDERPRAPRGFRIFSLFSRSLLI